MKLGYNFEVPGTPDASAAPPPSEYHRARYAAEPVVALPVRAGLTRTRTIYAWCELGTRRARRSRPTIYRRSMWVGRDSPSENQAVRVRRRATINARSTPFPPRDRIRQSPASPLWSRVAGFQVSGASGCATACRTCLAEAIYPGLPGFSGLKQSLRFPTCLERWTPASLSALPNGFAVQARRISGQSGRRAGSSRGLPGPNGAP